MQRGGRIMRWRERTSCGFVSDLIKLVLTYSDAHLSHSAVLGGLTLIPRQDRNSQASPHTKKRCGILLVVKQWRQA